MSCPLRSNHLSPDTSMIKLFCTLVLALSFHSATLFAGTGAGDGAASILETAGDREISRRQENLVVAEEALKSGDAALQRNDLASAYEQYKRAVELVPQGSETAGLHGRSVSRFSSTAVRYAEYLVSQGDYAKAESVARGVLEPAYNPDYRPAAVFLSRLEQPDYFNKTITPSFAQEREEVSQLLGDANGFYDSGRYDMAQKRYQQALALDKDNAAAYRGLEQVEVGKQRYYESAYNETRSRMLWQVEKAWARPKQVYNDSRVTDGANSEQDRRGTELMIARLNQIIVPSVNFQDATIQDAMAFLRQKSRELGDTDQNSRGINILLKLPSGSAALRATGDPASDQGSAPSAFNDRITLHLSNVPLYEVLRYIATLSGLKVKVEPFAVSVVPLSEVTETLAVREFKVPPGFITAGATGGADATGPQAGSAGADANTAKLANRQTAKDFLESQGVQFPVGASARFIPGSSKLVVRNTADNLDLIESLVDAAMGDQPTQVEIEAKFVEVSQNNLKELGFDWRLGPFAIGDSGVYGAGGDAGNAAAVPFINPGTGGAIGGSSVTSGLRSGNSAISANSLGALLGQGLGGAGPSPAIFSIAGIFTNPQFQVVIRALNQKKGVDLMAAPKVTTKSGQKATITISREFPYPQQYEPPQIPQDSSGGNVVNGNAGGNTADPVVTPSFPTDFTTRDLGVTLEVEPQIGPDGYTIDLTLSPEVVDFDGFINYGSPISVPSRTFLGQQVTRDANDLILGVFDVFTPTTPRILTENVINQPIFSKRKVTTNVSIWDGQTVVLGGLIREDVQKVSDKVPILGDIPLAGTLFRSQVDQKIKRNLIIFTTARLMDAAGQLLRPQDDSDQEEIVDPVGLPKDLSKPSLNPKSFSRK